MIRTLSIAAAFALAACGQPTAPTANTSAETSVADPHAPPVQSGEPVTPASLIGRWGDNGDCTKDIVFNADGTFASYSGGGGTWSLNGDVVTMSGAGGAFQVRVETIGPNQLMIHNPDGSFGVSQRC